MLHKNKLNLNNLLALLLVFLTVQPAIIAKGDRILDPGSYRTILLGPVFGINYNMHKGEFVTSDNSYPCCGFDNGTGVSFVFGGKLFYPVTDEIYLTPRLQFEGQGGDFKNDKINYPILGPGNRLQNVNLQDDLKVSLYTLNLDIFGAYDIAGTGLYVCAGPSFQFVVVKNFKQTEKIVTPSESVFLDGSRERTLYDESRDIVNTFQFAIRGGLGYDWNLGSGIHLNPEALYSYSLTKLSKDYDWKVSNIQFSLSILFEL